VVRDLLGFRDSDIFIGPDRYVPSPDLLTYIDKHMNVLEANSGILWK
jgi:hypothetical protein